MRHTLTPAGNMTEGRDAMQGPSETLHPLRRAFKAGDRVRDCAELGGTVLETWGNGVKVAWNNGHTGWVDERFLHRASGEGDPKEKADG
jgi:hypothetical protein